jgi:Na+/proline symporter
MFKMNISILHPEEPDERDFLPVIILGIFDKCTDWEGAILGMLTGLIFTIYYSVGVKFYGMVRSCFGVSAEGVGPVGMVITFIVTWSMSRLMPPPPADVQALVEELRSPIHKAPPLEDLDEEELDECQWIWINCRWPWMNDRWTAYGLCRFLAICPRLERVPCGLTRLRR